MIKWGLLTDTEKLKNKTCVFEIYDKSINNVRECGKPAYGKKGATLRICLCEEHFHYAKVMSR